MSNSYSHDHEEDQDEDHQILEEEDIVEVHEDDDGEGFEPMDEEDYNDDANFDGEIVIGGPGPGEEDEMMEEDGEGVRPEDNSWAVTALHKPQQSIFTLSLHPSFPNPPLSLSGGEDDLGYIFCPIPSSSSSPFNADTFPSIALTGHTDSVIATGWSFDGEMVATGGMDGKVRVWRRVNGKSPQGETASVDNWRTWEFLTSLDTGDEIAWMTWHPKGNVLAVGCEDSSVWMWQLPSGNTMIVLSGHTSPTTAGLFLPPLGKQLLTSSLDSSLILWDPRTSTPIFKSSIFCPPNSPNLDPLVHGITALAVSPSGQLAAVGGASGQVRLVNLTKGDTVGRMEGHSEGESVEALCFVDLLAGAGGGKGVVVVSGATDGKGFVWDVATCRVRAELKHDDPITSIYPHPAPALHLVTTASADSTLKTWDIRTGALIATHKGHAGVVNGLAVGPAPSGTSEQGQVGQLVLSAGDEGVSLIWKI